MKNCITTLKYSLAFFFNLNTYLTPSNSTPMDLPNKNKNICPQKILYTNLLGALLIGIKIWNKAKHPSIRGCFTIIVAYSPNEPSLSNKGKQSTSA